VIAVRADVTDHQVAQDDMMGRRIIGVAIVASVATLW